ncbi:hypothetical protein Bpfe_022697 [Biomphalaria pfeifferi]|uniref:Uncharacterized protein n=1 Tax=Biomphalaria pfeifferi TaxID=112525 RepID=A0AAD8F259_BIOPF|nr:hypothetical protein Bpfe_022697 [Biomphalaria pfeifferi]
MNISFFFLPLTNLSNITLGLFFIGPFDPCLGVSVLALHIDTVGSSITLDIVVGICVSLVGQKLMTVLVCCYQD